MRFTGDSLVMLKADVLARGASVQTSAVAAVRSGAKVLEAGLIESAPIAEESTLGKTSLEPGEMRDSIGTKAWATDTGATAVTGPTGKAAVVAGWVEWGHVQTKGRVRIDAKGRQSGPGEILKLVPAHPWARPSFERNIDDAADAVADVLNHAWESGKAVSNE